MKDDATCDVLIVGGGITGALMAFQVCSEGYKTILIDKNDIALGSTSATTAILQYELDEPLYSLIDKVGEEIAVNTYKHGIGMIDMLAHLVHQFHFDCGFEMKDSVYFSRTPEDAEWLHKELECRKKHGLGVAWLKRNEILRHYHIDGHGAIVSENAASVDAYALTHQLLHHCVVNHGLRVYDHTAMADVTNSVDGTQVITDNQCQIRCKTIVYATGYESQSLLREPVAKLVSTYALVSEPLNVVIPSIYTSVFWDTSKPYFYMRTTTDGRLLVGGADEPFENPDRRDALIDAKDNELMRLFMTALPDMSMTPDFSWAGTFGLTKDSMPYIGRHPDHDNAFFVLGYGGNGITFSLMAMKMLSDALAGRDNKFSNYFRFNR